MPEQNIAYNNDRVKAMQEAPSLDFTCFLHKQLYYHEARYNKRPKKLFLYRSQYRMLIEFMKRRCLYPVYRERKLVYHGIPITVSKQAAQKAYA